jgi:hypothetical protein
MGAPAASAHTTHRSASGSQHGFTPVQGGSNGAAARAFALTRGKGKHLGLTKQHTKGHAHKKTHRSHTKHVATPHKPAAPKTHTTPTGTTPAPSTPPKTQSTPKTHTTPTHTTPQQTPTVTTPTSTTTAPTVTGGGTGKGRSNGNNTLSTTTPG